MLGILAPTLLCLSLLAGCASRAASPPPASGAAIPSPGPSVDTSQEPTPTASSLASSTPDDNATPGWTGTGDMVEARSQYTATLLPDGTVLVTGGYGNTPAGSDGHQDGQASAELYDPGSGTWTATGEMIEARWGHTATLLPDGRVLVTGGCCADDGLLASAELYDPASGSWTATANMIEARNYHTATLLSDGTVLVAGDERALAADGGGEPQPWAYAEIYDPVSASWTATAKMVEAEARIRHTATLLPDGRVLVAGGCCSGSLPETVDSIASAELYDPVSGSWTATGRLIEPRDAHTATLLPDGRVFVAGGSRSSGGGYGIEPDLLASAELYDPRSGSWTATGNMIEAASFHTATLLSDGSLLVVGACCGGLLAPAEVYDPGSGSWTAAGGTIAARSGHTATLLPGGRVLVAGGSDGSRGVVLASAELYDPRGGT